MPNFTVDKKQIAKLACSVRETVANHFELKNVISTTSPCFTILSFENINCSDAFTLVTLESIKSMSSLFSDFY